MKTRRRVTLQLWVAVVLTLAGLLLIFCGFWVAPTGVIDSSVLVAFGEISTFAGGLFGIDYTYKWKRLNNNNRQDNETD